MKLGDCATFINGYAFKPTDWSTEGLPIIRIQDLTGSMNNTNYYNGKLDEKYLVKNGDILISWSASLGIYEWKNEDAYLNQHIFKVVFNKEKFDKKYFIYLIKSKLIEMQKNTHGSTMKHITKSNFDKIEIPKLDLGAQIIIGNILSKIEEIINIKEQQINNLNELIKSKFVEMFGDININDKKWNEDILKNNLSVVGGYAFKSSEFQENGIPILRIGNINTGQFRPKDLMFWKEEKSLENYAIYPDDVLMSLTGTVGKEDYGNICIIGNEYPKYYLNQRNAKLNIKETLKKEYISYALRVPEIKRRLTGISRGVRQANISNKDIENLKLPIPPIELQNQFADFVKKINKQKLGIQKSLEEMKKLQESLMNKYFGD